MAGSKAAERCGCYDGRDGHPLVGSSRCTNTERLVTLWRVDQEDRTGTRFCRHCAADALESGLYSEERAR